RRDIFSRDRLRRSARRSGVRPQCAIESSRPRSRWHADRMSSLGRTAPRCERRSAEDSVMATYVSSIGDRFEDRRDAGRRLAPLLDRTREGDPVVLALPRGGVPVGYEVARALGAPLDVLVVRKLGVPGHEELAMGAVAAGGARVLNEEVLLLAGVRDDVLAEVTERERAELARRERAYRAGREAVP